ncbi:MAG: WecB/TagA/CpsF family glycosyltransferase [Acidimicrobiales bacterium]
MDDAKARSVEALEDAAQATPPLSFARPAENHVFGCRLHAIDVATLFGLIDGSIRSGERRVIASQNIHGVHTHLVDPAFRLLHDSPETMVHIDGTPLVWLSKLKGDQVSYQHRTGCIDWVPELFSLASQRAWRVFHLGTTPETLANGLEQIRATHPDLLIEGRNGFFDIDPASQENREVVEKINAADPDILLVGLGMGRQEQWILQNKERLNVPVIITTGALIKLLAGELNMAPRWLGPLGLEWVFRLFDNFGETSRRYLLEPFQIIVNSTRRTIRTKRSGLASTHELKLQQMPFSLPRPSERRPAA